MTDQSRLRPSSLGGVPVLSRATRSGSSRSRAARRFEGGSPARPPAYCSSPTWMRPPRKVPTVSTTAGAAEGDAGDGDDAGHALALDHEVGRPPAGRARGSAGSRAGRGWPGGTAPGRPGRAWRAPPAPCWRSGCGTGCRRRSAARAMAPPSASISRTRCPLPMPPMAGLQLIGPSVSMLWVSSRVRAPMRAAASAASVPAWPPPTTMTSYAAEAGAGRMSVAGMWFRAAAVRARIVGRGGARTRACLILPRRDSAPARAARPRCPPPGPPRRAAGAARARRAGARPPPGSP